MKPTLPTINFKSESTEMVDFMNILTNTGFTVAKKSFFKDKEKSNLYPHIGTGFASKDDYTINTLYMKIPAFEDHFIECDWTDFQIKAAHSAAEVFNKKYPHLTLTIDHCRGTDEEPGERTYPSIITFYIEEK